MPRLEGGQAPYIPIDLGTLGGLVNGQGISDSGLVTGAFMANDGKLQTFVWSPANGMQPVPRMIGNADSAGFGINDAGQIAGYSGDQAVLFTPGQGNRPLTSGEARAVNKLGEAVGTNGDGVAFYLTDGARPLPGLGGNRSNAFGLNDEGDAVGFARTMSGDNFAVLWSEGQVVNLGALPTGTASTAFAINNKGNIVGASAAGGGEVYAFFLPQGGQMLGLQLGAFPTTQATSINELDEVVGNGTGAGGDRKGWLWQRGWAGPVALNVLTNHPQGWDFQEANGINEFGEIVGTGIHNGAVRAFVLVPSVDRRPPILYEPSAAPANVPTAGGPVTLRVRARDNVGVTSAKAIVVRQDNDQTVIPLTLISGTATEGTWGATFNAPANNTPHAVEYHVIYEGMDARGLKAGVQPNPEFVVAPVGGGDTRQPKLKDPSANKTVFPSTGGHLVLRVTASDNVGVASVEALITPPPGSPIPLPMTRVSGDERRGRYEAKFTLPVNASGETAKYAVTFRARDTAKNERELRTKPIKVKRPPRR